MRARKAAAKVTKKPQATAKSAETPFRNLHIVSAVLYVLLAVAAVAFMKDTSYQLTVGYLAKDALQSAQTGTTVLGPAAHAVWDVQLRYLVAAIMLLSAVVPVLYLTKLKNSYRQALDKKVAPWRWLDVGVTMAMVVGTVALLSGLSDIPTLKVVGLTIMITALLGWVAEKQASGKRLPAAYAVSLLIGVLPWVIIVPYAVATVVYGSLVAPWYTYALYVTTVVAVTGLALNQYRQHRQLGKWSDYRYAEGKYLSFNLFGKVAFGLILILGLLK